MSVALTWAFTLAFITVVIIVGIYMIIRLDSGFADMKRELDVALKANNILREEVRTLKAELQLAKRIRGANDE